MKLALPKIDRRVVVACALLSLVSSSVQAASSDAEKQARRSFEKAEAHFKAGLFAEALGEYQEGYDRLPLPGFLINIAQCQRRLGDLSQARTTYRKFIMVAPDSPYVPEVKSLIAELENLLDSGERDTSTSPPKQTPTMPAAGTTDENQDEAAGGGPADTSAAALVTLPAEPSPPAPSRTRWWLWGGVGGAIVAGVVTAVLLSRSPETTTVHDGSLGTLRR